MENPSLEAGAAGGDGSAMRPSAAAVCASTGDDFVCAPMASLVTAGGSQARRRGAPVLSDLFGRIVRLRAIRSFEPSIRSGKKWHGSGADAIQNGARAAIAFSFGVAPPRAERLAAARLHDRLLQPAWIYLINKHKSTEHGLGPGMARKEFRYGAESNFVHRS